MFLFIHHAFCLSLSLDTDVPTILEKQKYNFDWQLETDGSEAVSEMMVEKTRKPAGGPGMTGGSIRRLLQLYRDIMAGHQAEDGGLGARRSFTENMLQSTSNIMELAVGWQEIPDSDGGRFETTSQMLSSIDLLGFIYGSNGHASKTCEDEQTDFVSDNIKLAIFAGEDDNESKCFAAGDLGSICLPNTDDSSNPGCSVNVASLFKVQEEAMFLVENKTDEASSFLSNNLIGLTVNNAPYATNTNTEIVRVTIKHNDVQVTLFLILYLVILLFLTRILRKSECVPGGTCQRTPGRREVAAFPLKRAVQPRLSASATTSPTLGSSLTTLGRRTPTTRH